MAALASTDAESIAELFEEHGDAMRRRARRVLGSEADAQDAVQEVMLSVLNAPHLLSGVERVGGWLLTLVRRRAIDLVRSNARRKARESAEGIEELFQGAPDPEALMERDEVARLVASALEALSPSQREAFVGNVLDGLTFKVLSRKTGVPMGTLMANKKKALDFIRARLVREGVIPAPATNSGRGKE